jgi:hypothetical protein
MQGHAALIRVDNIELQLGQNLLHGFQIQPCPGDVRCLFILLLQRQKTAGLAEGIGDALLLVGLRLAQPRASLAPCFGNSEQQSAGGKAEAGSFRSMPNPGWKRIAGAVTGTANYRVSSSRLSWLSNVYDRVECRANELWLEVRQSFS